MFYRFGPAAVRRTSQTVAFNYSPYFEKDYTKMRIYDAGDAAGNPFNILTAMNQTYLFAKKLWNTSHRVIGEKLFNCESKQFNNLSDQFVCLSVCHNLEILLL